ncbi:putative FAD-linked oxidoreductase [Variibacter gotjawalensis]|uniref:Putative FAD-linked oxidoreductase n=1 Tax=Variibacter gotjawalensis TaxID=1333996 RepID=A0A0S3PR67_9BRAD|nr:FAD-binding oxidoreductase [Variibacter gotjawalensis]NIK48672.1 D-lactate dehydrogenase (cytochrome) [Variibacter gotjawalensis]RZS50533.1 4-phosphoerythronate dehydrogenase (FAD-dependent) [Variibacter gotjawalensis]BAT58368.1 putative FAD-linked oxidoreductase [Variibacter gotjawalensis]
MSDLLSRFAAIVGEKYAIRDPQDQQPYLVEMRDLYHGRTPLVLRPGSVAEVSAILKLANDSGTPIVPQGGNTGLVGGQVPHESNTEIVVSLKRLDRIREIDATSNTMTCEAGVVLASAQKAADEADRFFPLSLGAEGSCTIGGNLSSNAGGTGALAYGVARDLVVGLEVVLADGRVLNGLNKLKKDNTGYDLKNLFVGAEGTLGIITAAVLKMFPKLQSRASAFVGLKSPEDALRLLNLANARAGGSVTLCEIMPRVGLEFVLKHGSGVRNPLAGMHDWYVLIELATAADKPLRETLEYILGAAFEEGVVEDAAIADNLDQARSFKHLRETLAEIQKFEGGSIKHDVAVPVALVPELIRKGSAAAVKLIPGCRPVPFGHLGDGNIHFNITQPVGADKEQFLARWEEMNEVIHGLVADQHGSISAEHGIGQLKRHLLHDVKDPVAFALMQSLKKTLDPNNILNPGKVL